jgi:pRiA4b ORF-3-like protein
MSSTPAGPASLSRYQLRVVLHGISPLIWRRLLVPATATIAELHSVLQTVFGWGGEHLHRFVILGGPGFRDDARKVCLDELRLRAGERFTYEYNFIAGWRVDLRVEKVQPSEPARGYPRCVGGRRAGPPEDWAGRGRLWNRPSRIWCSPRSSARPRS